MCRLPTSERGDPGDAESFRRGFCGTRASAETRCLSAPYINRLTQTCALSLARLQILPASLAIDGAHVLENGQCFETLDDTAGCAVAHRIATATSGAPARGRLVEPR